jgi:hypothetical protein
VHLLNACITRAIKTKLPTIVFINKVYYLTKQRAAAIRRIDTNNRITFTWSPDFARDFPDLNPRVIPFAAQDEYADLNYQLGVLSREGDHRWPQIQMCKYDFGFSGKLFYSQCSCMIRHSCSNYTARLHTGGCQPYDTTRRAICKHFKDMGRAGVKMRPELVSWNSGDPTPLTFGGQYKWHADVR